MAGDDELLTIKFNISLRNLLLRLDDFAADQLPFAVAGALYDVALKAREEMREKAPSIFTIRQKKPWAERALTFDTKSKKTLRDKIKSGGEPSISIISKDEDLGPLLTDGGTRKRPDGKDMGVPIIGGGRRTPRTQLNRSKGPYGVLKNNPRSLIIEGKDGKRLLVIYPKKYKKGRIEGIAAQSNVSYARLRQDQTVVERSRRTWQGHVGMVAREIRKGIP